MKNGGIFMDHRVYKKLSY